jgi:hypothetical protein
MYNNKNFPSAFGGARREKSRYQIDREIRSQKQKEEKDAATLEEEKKEFNEINFPSLGNTWVQETNVKQTLNFAELASDWQRQDEVNKQKKEAADRRAARAAYERSCIIAPPCFGRSYSYNEDVYDEEEEEQEPQPLEDDEGFTTVVRKQRKPKRHTTFVQDFIPQEEEIEPEDDYVDPREKAEEDDFVKPREKGSIW